MLIGNKNDLETAIYLIKKVLLNKEVYNQQIHYHIDERGTYLAQLDYTATYPNWKIYE